MSNYFFFLVYAKPQIFKNTIFLLIKHFIFSTKKLKNKDIEIDFNISDRVKELKELLEAVKPYNKEQAKKLISETVADLHFIEHPDTEFYSFRLSNLKKEEEQR